MTITKLITGSVALIGTIALMYTLLRPEGEPDFAPLSEDISITVLEDFDLTDEWFSLVANISYTKDGTHYEYIPNLTIYTGTPSHAPSGKFRKFLRQSDNGESYEIVRSFDPALYPDGAFRPQRSYDSHASSILPLTSKKGRVLDYALGGGSGAATGNSKEVRMRLDGITLATFNTRDRLNTQYLGQGIIRQVGFLGDETTPVFHVDQGYDSTTDSELRITAQGDAFDAVGTTFQKGIVTVGNQSGPLVYDIGPLVIGHDYVEYLALDPHNQNLVRVTHRLAQ